MENPTLKLPLGARIGRVISVSATHVIVLLERNVDGDGNPIAPTQMGALVKIVTRVSTVFGMVSALRVPLPSLHSSETDLRIIEVELLGEQSREAGASGGFRRGVSSFPSLEDGVHAATPEDLAQVYAPPRVASVAIGTIHQDSSVIAHLLIDDLLGKHFSVVGTTGTGKSCAVASILRAVIGRNPNGHVLLMDPHDEYASAFGAQAVVLRPDDGLRLPFWLFNFEELAEIVLGSNSHHPEQRKILGDVVLAAKQTHFIRAGIDNHGTIDTPVPYRMSDVLRSLEAAMGSLSRPESVAAFQSVKNRIIALQNDARYAFVFGASLSLRDEMAEILSLLFRIPVNGRPVTILDLSGIPSEVLNVVVSVICRITFDFAVWSESPVPIMIVCEEAHRYAPRDSQLGFEPAKRALARIAKEGRKYGVSLCVVTQRPSDLTPSLLSECNTLFALRMSNHEDQEIVRGALPEASHGLMDFLPALRNGEAVVIGEGVSMPMRIAFARLPEEFSPKSATASFTEAWSRDVDDRSAILRTIDRWRRGARTAA